VKCRCSTFAQIFIFLANFSYFEKKEKKLSLCDVHAVCVSVYPTYQLLYISKPIFLKFGMYIMEPKPNRTAYFINPSHQFVCLYVSPFIVAGQRLGKNLLIFARQRHSKNFIAVTNTHATVEKLLEASFSMRSVSYQGKQANNSSEKFLFIFPFFFLPYLFQHLSSIIFGSCFSSYFHSSFSLFLPSFPCLSQC
jgi:hypothetical protein